MKKATHLTSARGSRTPTFRFFELVVIPSMVNCRTSYLSRINIISVGSVAIRLHKISESDIQGMFHDHPWSFLSLSFRNVYVEQILADGRIQTRIKRLRRSKAQMIHRVELHEARPVWTFVVTYGRRRAWGFFDEKGAPIDASDLPSLRVAPLSRWLPDSIAQRKLTELAPQ
jgi:hypothetical protein